MPRTTVTSSGLRYNGQYEPASFNRGSLKHRRSTGRSGRGKQFRLCRHRLSGERAPKLHTDLGSIHCLAHLLQCPVSSSLPAMYSCNILRYDIHPYWAFPADNHVDGSQGRHRVSERIVATTDRRRELNTRFLSEIPREGFRPLPVLPHFISRRIEMVSLGLPER